MALPFRLSQAATGYKGCPVPPSVFGRLLHFRATPTLTLRTHPIWVPIKASQWPFRSRTNIWRKAS